MSVKFASVFQNAIQFESDTTMSASELLDAFGNVATAQVDILPTRVNKIVTSLVKDKQLYIRPTVAVFDSKAYLVSGRHRAQAVIEFCDTYGMNAAGQPVKYTGDINDTALEPIIPEIYVEVIHVNSFQMVGHMQLEYNGSRSMTAAEKNLVQSTFAKLTALAKVQMALANRVKDSINVTFNTALSIAKALSAAFPKQFVYSTDEQLDLLSSWLVDFYEANESNEEIVPGNMARSYRKFVEAFLNYEVPTGELDQDDEEYTDSVKNLYGSGLVKPEKVAKSNSKVAELQAQIAELTAKLQAQGI